ncbi:lysozyme isoform X2 [Cephus cinctus]|uniref:lysozyme n=1 Tax=Cephus cinctus TaxID=211228 RepID=A0AAJ7FLI1_CEPCN|nr:lysozyme isoform X2 [Cephus cinctus]XP_015597740.1 lysozyme isoform X2 [Cephus cinctus]XP_015597741.1 lysozyme isoform X2 [Cephus cinctus]XP_015597742.1 lysozyme isoform X2 [Cephus cinctus]XP_024942004.1 lysozyme isoform X2 [Cephus cinctus]
MFTPTQPFAGLHEKITSSFYQGVCLVENESARNTSAIGGPNSNGSYDYGLFQINGKYWCAEGVNGGDCNMKCEDLIDDDITDDSKCCLEMIYPRHGFNAWHGWERKCKYHPLPDVTHCFNEVTL